MFTDILSIDVMGDAYTHDYAIGIRAVTSIGGMSSDWAQIYFYILRLIKRLKMPSFLFFN